MANQSLAEQLNQIVEVIIANRDEPLPSSDPRLTPLVRLAFELSGVSRADFKARLRADLDRRTSMLTASTKKEVKPIREGFRTVTPYIAVREANQVIDFVKNVFGAEGQIYGIGSQGGIHAEYKIGDSMLMIGGGETFRRAPNPAALHLYVEDVDAVYQRALQFGATSLMGPTDQEYGERGAAIQDVGGNHWYLATHKGPAYVPENMPNLMPYMNPIGAPKMIDFLKQAFDAEEIARYESPDGVVYHAKVKVGNSIIELGEAHGQWQPKPAMFMLYVDDVDAWYARAMQAEGAISMAEPADQPYGDRVGAVKDPFENLWYLGTYIKQTG